MGWKRLVERIDEHGDDADIWDRTYRCKRCKKEPLRGMGPAKNHVTEKHGDKIPADEDRADAQDDTDELDDVDDAASEESRPAPETVAATSANGETSSAWTVEHVDATPRKDRPHVEDDADDQRGQVPPRRQPTNQEPEHPEPEEMKPLAKSIRHRLDQSLINRGLPERELPPEELREQVDARAAAVLAKYVPTHGEEINLAFLVLVAYGPSIHYLRTTEEPPEGSAPKDQPLNLDQADTVSSRDVSQEDASPATAARDGILVDPMEPQEAPA